MRVPLCLIAFSETPVQADTAASRSAGEVSLTWVTEQPGNESEAMRLLDGLVRRHDPLEPFERAAAGLDEAFTAGDR